MRITYYLICILLCTTSLTSQNHNRKVVLKLDYNIELHLVEEEFDSTKHTFDYCKPGGPEGKWVGLCLIDGKPVYGTDWSMPFSYLKQAYILIDNKRINLDVSCMYDPMCSMRMNELFNVERIGGGFLIKGSFSDGAGSYNVNWSIINFVSIRTKISKEC